MSREFYTERDIEDLFKRGIMSLEVNDSVVLTELAYEKARSLGMNLVREVPDNPPCAPVRPYLSHREGKRPSLPVHVVPPTSDKPLKPGAGEDVSLEQRIRSSVLARLGTQVDSGLLDVIIKRVLDSTGMREKKCCSEGSGAPPCVPSSIGAPRV